MNTLSSYFPAKKWSRVIKKHIQHNLTGDAYLRIYLCYCEKIFKALINSIQSLSKLAFDRQKMNKIFLIK